MLGFFGETLWCYEFFCKEGRCIDTLCVQGKGGLGEAYGAISL